VKVKPEFEPVKTAKKRDLPIENRPVDSKSFRKAISLRKGQQDDSPDTPGVSKQPFGRHTSRTMVKKANKAAGIDSREPVSLLSNTLQNLDPNDFYLRPTEKSD